MTVVDAATIRRLADMYAVYRMFDEAGRLLYIGTSGRAGRRFDDHAVKRWFPLVSLITLEWCATQAEALLTEKRAIAAEKPRYNITGSPVAQRMTRSKPVNLRKKLVGDTILGDTLEVFGDDRGLLWSSLAERLAERFPQRWGGATREVVSMNCRARGVPSAALRMGDKTGRGCRRKDVEEMLRQQILKEAG